MMDDVIYFPAPSPEDKWSELADGFAACSASFSDVACIIDGTLIRTRRPSDFQGFYDKSGKPSYNCLAAIGYHSKFRYLGIFSRSNSDQSMWNPSAVLGARARKLCPPGINWLGDAGFKLWPFLMVLFDEREDKRLTKIQYWFGASTIFSVHSQYQSASFTTATITIFPRLEVLLNTCLGDWKLVSKCFMV
ncbi:unnamed protein product [Phytophthora fragariaefolia]|uniref:Unnamed protein product n=1 Tax=Phytophthora fragariaefolia TaxID=1490495 RepID=A0A9W6UE01_9STRA|nr:unnamed protein product [Phytophthora fragariaefolia]